MSTTGATRSRGFGPQSIFLLAPQDMPRNTTEKENQEGHFGKSKLMLFNISWKRAAP